MTNENRGGQFKLLAYVCGSSCVRYPDNIGTVTYQRIFIQRPDDCRYAVVGVYNVEKHADDVLVFDLYATSEQGSKVITPEPIGRHDDLDAAIMATAMLYRDE